MAIGVKVDPIVIVSGVAVSISERLEYLSDKERAAGRTPAVRHHEVTLFQGDNNAAVTVRYRVDRQGIPVVPLPSVGDYVALVCQVSEGSFRDEQDRERSYVNLIAQASAHGALDYIYSTLTAMGKEAA